MAAGTRSVADPILSPLEAAERLLAETGQPARLLVAISGGSDSTGLMAALLKSNPPGSGISIAAATVDHALRPESADEARSVAALCEKLGVPHFIRRWDGPKPSTGLSAASREARYRLLLDLAEEIDATAILTGHTLDDQVETIAMRATRSDGEDNAGLAGMAEAVLLGRRRWLLRPFLKSRRADIRTFLEGEGIGWIDDPSNLNSRYERVRVREGLSGRENFDLSGREEAARRRRILSDAAAALVAGHVTLMHGVLAHVAPEGLAAEPEVRRYGLGMLAALLGGRSFGPGGDSMDRVMAFLDGRQPGRITAGRVIFDLRRDGLYISRENRGLLPLHIASGQTATWDGRYRIVNRGEAEIVVGSTAPDRDEALSLFPDVPPAVAMRAAAVMPCISSVGGGGDLPAKDAIQFSPTLGPFDRFLPQFDVNLASRFAVLLGCDVFPRLPIKDSSRKS